MPSKKTRRRTVGCMIGSKRPTPLPPSYPFLLPQTDETKTPANDSPTHTGQQSRFRPRDFATQHMRHRHVPKERSVLVESSPRSCTNPRERFRLLLNGRLLLHLLGDKNQWRAASAVVRCTRRRGSLDADWRYRSLLTLFCWRALRRT